VASAFSTRQEPSDVRAYHYFSRQNNVFFLVIWVDVSGITVHDVSGITVRADESLSAKELM